LAIVDKTRLFFDESRHKNSRISRYL